MVVGMDAFHNTPGKKDSIFGFVATVDRNFSKYFSHSHVLPSGQEITPFLQQVYEKALKEFKEQNGIYPKQVFSIIKHKQHFRLLIRENCNIKSNI